METKLRFASTQDIDAIYQLMSDYASEEKERFELLRDFIPNYLTTQNSAILLAYIENRVVGLLCFSFRPDLWHGKYCCYLEELFVRKEDRKKGIGSLLLKSALNKAKERNCAEISLSVDKNNLNAIRLYKKLGLDEEVLSLEMHFK
jgi:ribosomal protein S18 acetylase RimI-like enzyme